MLLTELTLLTVYVVLLIKGARATDITIDTLCNIMTSSSLGDVIDRYAKVNAALLSAYDLKCLDFKYDNMIADLRKTGWGESHAEGGKYKT